MQQKKREKKKQIMFTVQNTLFQIFLKLFFDLFVCLLPLTLKGSTHVYWPERLHSLYTMQTYRYNFK